MKKMSKILIEMKKKKRHLITNRGNFGNACWCGDHHRIVRNSSKRWKGVRVIMLEDIEAE